MLASLIQSFVAGEVSGAARRVRGAVVAYAIAGVLVAIGIGFLIAAAYIEAATRFGALHAALGLGGIFMLLAILTLLIHGIVSRVRERKRAQEARAAQLKTAVSVAAVALLPTLLKNGGVLGAIAPIAALAAYAIYKENGGSGGSDDTPGQGSPGT